MTIRWARSAVKPRSWPAHSTATRSGDTGVAEPFPDDGPQTGWYHSLLTPAGLLLKIAVFRARLYEQPGGTCAAGPSFTVLKPSTSKPDDWAASLAAAKHSLAGGGCWPAGHSLALRVQPGGVRGTPSAIPLTAAEARGAGTANATAWLARGSAIYCARARVAKRVKFGRRAARSCAARL